MEAKFQMDCYGHFRIVVDGIEGEPVSYEGIASVEVNGETYIGVSQYYGAPPSERIFRLVPMDSKMEDTSVCDLFNPEIECSHKGLKGKE